jgi:single-stranded DNA-binding protein
MQQDAMITLTGYLGRDRQIRETQGRDVLRREPPTRLEFHLGDFKRYEEYLQDSGWYEATTPSREYAILALATSQWKDGKDQTTWYRVVVWNPDRDHRNVRLCRKGDRVKITGRKSSFRTHDGRLIPQVELVNLETVRTKSPEVP